MKKINILIIAVFSIALIMVACNSGDSGFKETENGLKYKFHIDKDGISPVTGDFITMSMSYGLKDSIIFNSAGTGQKEIQMPLPEVQFSGDVYECIGLMSAGDSATFIMSADSFFIITARSQHIPEFIEPNSDLYFNIKLVDVQSIDALRENESTLIENYISENNITTQADENGIYFIEHKKGKGELIEGEIVTMNYTLKLLSGEVVFDSKERNEPIPMEYGKKMDTEGFMLAVQKLKIGSIVTVIVPSAYAYGEQGAPQGGIGPYSPLLYEIEILNSEDKAIFESKMAKKGEADQKLKENEEVAILKNYLASNNITVKPTASGLYLVEKKAGSGATIQSGDTVFVHYTLTSLTNDTIDSSFGRGTPLDFVIDAGGMITGWNEAVKLMKTGGKARAIIPSKIAYGARGKGPQIPPFTSLIFDLEVVQVKRK